MNELICNICETNVLELEWIEFVFCPCCGSRMHSRVEGQESQLPGQEGAQEGSERGSLRAVGPGAQYHPKNMRSPATQNRSLGIDPAVAVGHRDGTFGKISALSRGQGKEAKYGVLNCAYCGILYPAFREWSKYCSKDCRTKAWKDRQKDKEWDQDHFMVGDVRHCRSCGRIFNARTANHYYCQSCKRIL